MKKAEIVALAHGALEESENLDFKSRGDPSSPGFWCETVKDIIAMANTTGGAIVFGCRDDGSPSGCDTKSIMVVDQADIANKVAKYTGANLSSLSINPVERNGVLFPAIIIEPVTIAIPFTKPGTYNVEKGKQKNAFSVGTIYVRHGTKSEPCTREDVRLWIERRIEEVRESWLGNIRKVVEAPLDHQIVVATSKLGANDQPRIIAARVSGSPDAIPVRVEDPESTWPLRECDIVKMFAEAPNMILMAMILERSRTRTISIQLLPRNLS